MKRLYLSLVFVTTILTLASASTQTKSDLTRDQLIGPVHTLQVDLAQIATIDGKEVEIGRKHHQRVVYDRRGTEIERINFDEKGARESRTVYITDAHGRVLGWKEYEAATGGRGERITSRSEWLYDKSGNRVEARVYSGESLSHLTTARYDHSGLMIEEIVITDGGEWKQTKKYGYDSRGRRIRTLGNTNGTTELIEASYNDAGNLICYKYSGADGRNDSVSRYVFDAQGREIESSGEGSLLKSKVATSYDSKGRVLRRVTQCDYEQPNVRRSHAPEPGTVEFRYNESNQLIEERAYSAEGTLRRRTVTEYDRDGRTRAQVYFHGATTVVGMIINGYDSRGNRVKTLTIDSDPFGKTVTHVEHRLLTFYSKK